MNSRRTSGLAAMPKGILAVLAAGGIVLSLLMARVDTQQYRAIERLRIGEAVDAHFTEVTDYLTTRENLAATIARLFRPPPLSAPRPLAQLGTKILALAPDISSMGWLPQVGPKQVEDAVRSMRASGLESAAIRGADGKPVDVQNIERQLYPIIDVVPDSARSVIGLDVATLPERLAAIRQAQQTRAVARTAPTPLRQDEGSRAFVLYAPVFGDDDGFLGVIGFGYKIEELIGGALSTKRGNLQFSVRVVSMNDNQTLFESPKNGLVDANAQDITSMQRTSTFGGRDLTFVYSVQRNLTRESLLRGMWVAVAGFCLTGAAILFLGFMANRAAALAQEVASRRDAEDRLKIVIHELNHRVRNVMTVAQAVVRLSFTSGYNLADVQKTCEGRLQALSNAMTLLTASDWRSVGLRQLITDDIIPFAERITVSGPDISLRPRAAQTFALLFYELATNAAKHGALSMPLGQVHLTWTIDHTAEEPLFKMTWRETGGPPVNAPSRRGFGELLVRRIAPRDVAGRSTVNYNSEGFQYELEAPLKELIDPKGDKPA
ncbi:MAG: CHASE domain-containing protein [Pseudorhodoplanes sp.]|nr:CHASE domain-containing protein [Pseudorhodoplanes sp.]